MKLFIKYKTNGSQVEFAEMMAWQPQYLNKLLKGGSFGYNPIVALLKKFPELDARWLILGEGEMIMKEYAESVIKKKLVRLMEVETLMPYMSAEQIQRISAGCAKFTDKEMQELRNKKNDTQISTYNLQYIDY